MLVDGTGAAAPDAFFARSLSVHVFRLSSAGTIDACNDATASNLRLTPTELVGRPIFDFLTGTDAKRLSAELLTPGVREEPILLNFCDSRQLPYTLHCWLDVRPDHAVLIGEPPLRDDQDSQRALMQVTQELAALVRDRARLAAREREARLAAEAADKEKDRGLTILAHELRQPLGAMRFATEILARNATPGAYERARATLVRQVTQLTRLVEDLLDAARLRENKFELRRAPLDLNALLSDLAEATRVKASGASIEFQCSPCSEAVWVDADSSRMTQVLSNLIDNAIKYTTAGGRVTVGVTSDRGDAMVTVRDTGRGISPELLPRIFQLFAQEAEGERGGLGIGLAIVKGIVVMHGGRIEVRSAGIGRGSEFIVRLPMIAAPQASAIS